MPANTAKMSCLPLTQSLNFSDERERRKATKASRSRSVSPPRSKVYDWEEFSRIDEVDEDENGVVAAAKKPWRWSLKEFLYRSISEGRGRAREKEMERERLVQAALRAEKKKKPTSKSLRDHRNVEGRSDSVLKKLSPRSTTQIAPKVQRRCAVSAHERYYSANRARAQAQAERLKKKTFLPYRQVLLGFLGPFQSSNSGILSSGS